MNFFSSYPKIILYAITFFSASHLYAQNSNQAQTSQINEQLIDYLSNIAQPYADATDSEIQVTISDNSQTRLNKAPCQQPTISLAQGARPTGKTTISLSCPDNWKIRVNAQVALMNTVPVATRALSAGYMLTPSDWILSEVDITAWPKGVILDSADLSGTTLARPVRQGEPIPNSSSQTQGVDIIKSGTQVDVLLIGEGFIIRSSGTTIQSSKTGDTVRVKLESGKTVSGQLNADRQVEVRF